jgi:uncharacterized protein YtpQ (UPF0354 family)
VQEQSDGSRCLTRLFPILSELSTDPVRDRDAPLAKDFLKGFQIRYLVREDKGKPTLLTKRVAASLRLRKDVVHAAAVRNLTKDCASATFKFFDSDEGGVLLFDSVGDLHASRLLLPGIYRWLNKFMGGPFVVGVPNRDVLIAVAETNRTALEGLPADLEASYRTARYPITLRTFRVTPDGVAILGQPPGG